MLQKTLQPRLLATAASATAGIAVFIKNKDQRHGLQWRTKEESSKVAAWNLLEEQMVHNRIYVSMHEGV